MKNIKRSFLSILLSVSLALLFFLPSYAASSSTKTYIKFSPELASTTAENFALNLGGKFHAISTTKIYTKNDQAIGYIVNLQDDNNNTGYVVFDNTQDSLISEFSFKNSTKCGLNSASSPYTLSSSNSSTTSSLPSYKKSSFPTDSTKMYKIGPFTYEAKKSNPSSNTYRLFSSGKPTSKWNDVFVSVKTIYENYNLVKTNHLADFYTLTEDTVEEVTKHYACAVSASYICGSYYGANLGAIDESILKKDYMDIWSKTKTTVHHISLGITYGQTALDDITPGINSYLKSKNISARGTYVNSPSYSKFTNTIDSKNIAMIHCGINTDKGRDGHSMAVEGYCTISKKSDNSQIHTLMACDGWYAAVRYINLDYAYWTDYEGTFFHE